MHAPGRVNARLNACLRAMRGTPQTWLILAGVALFCVLAAGAMATVEQFRRNAIRASSDVLKHSALVLSRHFDREFESFTMLQAAAETLLQGVDSVSPEVFSTETATLAVHETLRSKASEYSDPAGISVFDATGTLINSSQKWPVTKLNVSDRNYFLHLKNDPSLLADFEPVVGRIQKRPVLVFAHRLVNRNGEFLGIVTRAMQVSQIETFLASAAMDRDTTISLYHRNGQLLARSPRSVAAGFERVSPGSIQAQAISQAPISRVADDDGKESPRTLFASSPLESRAAVVVVSKSLEATLAAWRSQTSFFASMTIVSTALMVLTFYAVMWQLSRHLKKDKTRLLTAINTMSQGLLMFDSQARLIVCNNRYIEMYGLSPDVVQPGVQLRDLIHHRHAKGLLKDDVDNYCAQILERKGRPGRLVSEMPDGRLIEITTEPVRDGGWLVIHEDVTERVRAETRIARLAHYDSLTGLPNRFTLHDHLRRRFEEAQGDEAFGLLYIDLDSFKSVNDTLGHGIGDQLLQSVADCLRHCAGPNDLVARLGGDEFAVVSDDGGEQALAAMAERILAALREVQCEDLEIGTEASIGVAIAPGDGKNVEELLRRADLAMYAAKAEGRRTYRFFEPDLDAKAQWRQQIELDLRHALANEELEIHYQPVLDLKTDVVTGCEALLRWRHPQRGLISPGDFIPVAEQTGAIIEIGEWLLRHVCREAASWPTHVRAAINVSPVQFRSKTFTLNVAAALAETGLSPGRLELEITETILIEDDEQARLILGQLRQLGVRIALDDFGTGYSSLSYLHRFAFDKIKIDRSFVAAMSESNDTIPIVKAVIDMASARRMIATAEGVETQRQHDLLSALGCHEMQGFLFSPAVPAKKLPPLFSGLCPLEQAV